MALVRRCARLLWIRSRFVNLHEKINKNHLPNEPNRGYVLHTNTQTRSNSQFETNISTLKPNAALDATNSSSDPLETSGGSYTDLKNIIDKKSRNITSEDEPFTLRLLESCRDMLPDADLESRRDLVLQAWNLVEKMARPPTTEHYNLLLRIYAKNSMHLNSEEFLRNMKSKPDRNTYQLLLNVAAEIGDYSQVLTIMAKIKDMGYPVNEETFNSLILAYSVNADVDGAQQVIVTMQAARIELGAATYCALARGFAAKGDSENLKRILSIGNLSTKQLMSVVKSLSNSQHGEHISEVMKYFPRGSSLRSNEIVCTIVELTHLGKAKDAFEIVNCLPVVDSPIDSDAAYADFFVHEMVKSETLAEEIMNICENLVSSEKHPTALLKATETALRLKKEDKALLAFETMQKRGVEIRPHFYWPLLINAASTKREVDLIRLIKHMIEHGVYLDDETLRDYAIPFLSTTDPLMIVRKLQDCGLKISNILTPLLAMLLNKGNLKRAITLTEKIKGKIDSPVVIKHLVRGYIVTKNAYGTATLLSNINSTTDQNGQFVLDLLAHERVTVTNEELADLVCALDKKNLRISRTAVDALQPRINRLKEPKDLQDTFKRLISQNFTSTDMTYAPIPHPRDMNAEELENHLADLSAKRMNTRGVLRRLVQTHCSKKNLNKAAEFADMFTSKGFEWTTGMISGMFNLYATNGVLDKAEIMYNELKTKHKRFKVDEYKIIDYATALVKNNELEKALEVLGEQDKVRSGPDTVRNCWRLLNAVAETRDSRNTNKFLDTLVRKGYCEIDNHILGTLVRTHLSDGDLKAAVEQFKECFTTYRKLPLIQELIRALVEACTNEPEYQKDLMDVLEMLKNIHGESSSNSQLFMALACTNKRKELHTFMKVRVY